MEEKEKKEEEKKIDLVSFNEIIEQLKESLLKSKDYIKFIIGLSTGTLVISATLTKEFVKIPQYNFILIIGWSLLFISIILGVWILPLGDSIQSKFELTKKISKSPEKVDALLREKIGGHYLIEWIKKITHYEHIESKKLQDFFKSLENYLKTKELKHKQFKVLKGLTEDLSTPGVKDEYKQMAKDMITELFKFYSIFKYYGKVAYFPSVLKSIRWIIWQMRYLEKGMRYSFFVGMLAILVFAIINFTK